MSEIRIRTLTPLWTGDINQECNRIKETGIIGSLRWWYEALVRGLGGYACDPTDTNCQFNYNRYKKTGKIEDGFTWEDHPKRNVCDVCKLFGCTGWEKKFNFRVNEDVSTLDINFLTKLKDIDIENISELDLEWWYNKTYNKKKAFYNNENFPIEIFSNSTLYSNSDITNILGSLFKVISEMGSIGAKTQNGFGVIDLQENDIDIQKGFEFIKDTFALDGVKNDSLFEDYFKIELSFDNDFINDEKIKFENSHQNSNILMTGQMIKYLIRKTIKNNDKIVNKICNNVNELSNTLEDKKDSQENNVKKVVARHLLGSDLEGKQLKRKSILHFSSIWKKNGRFRMRIWGFVPNSIEFNNRVTKIDKEQLILQIINILSTNFNAMDYSISTGNQIIKELIK